MKPYPQVIEDKVEQHTTVLKQISRLRQEDVQEFSNLNNVFVSGRTVNKVPSSSADVVVTDRIGDQNLTKDYAYFCVSDGAGASVWRRIVMDTW